MTPEPAAGAETLRWQRVEGLFHEALELPKEARDAFLAEACGEDAELRAELASLLDSPEMTLGGLRGAVAETAEALIHAEAEPLSRLGAYRILRTLGEGGMGTVYLAERDDDQYKRRVAIKVLRAALSRSPELQALFRRERQILADLDHPNIARMLDGGITPAGSPYLVMEYIDGAALDAYCRDRNLGLDARLGLFRTLCEAVAYAQGHMVIHRDLKPMNVLVGQDGAPKLLDFGIAKLIAPFEPGAQVGTTLQTKMLTPDYASPEQLMGQPVSTATDVYALGVLLFELLTGELPFGLSRLSTAPESGNRFKSRAEQARAICEDPPQPPSEVCLRTGCLVPAEARRLRGDLDCFILKALGKRPGERYAGAAQMLADLNRYQKHLPLEAARQNLAYTTGKFVERHRVGVILAGVVALLIVGFAVGMGVLARRATAGEARARREEAFLASIFQTATPEGAKGGKQDTRQMLDQAVVRLKTEFAGDAQLQGAIAENIGEAYMAQGLYDQAEPLLQQALGQIEATDGRASKGYLADLANLANNYRLKGQYEQAEPLLRRALEMNRARHPEKSFEVAHAESMLGECLYLEDKNADSEALLRQALATERSIDANLQDGTRSYLALVLERRGAFPEAADLLRESTEISARLEGRESADYLISLHNLAGAEIDAGDLDGAARSDREVLDTRRRIWGRDHPDTAYSLNNLGFIYLEQGRWQQAEPLLRENVAITAKLADGTSPRYAIGLANEGRVEEQKGNFAGAADFYNRGHQVLVAAKKTESLMEAKIEVYQALLETDRGDMAGGARMAEEAVALQRKLGGPNDLANPQLSSGLLALGQARLLGGDPSAGEAAFRQALAIRQQTYPATHPEVLLVEARLAETLLAERKAAGALEMAESALRAAQAAPYPMPQWRTAELNTVKALALAAGGRTAEAAALAAANEPGLESYNQPAVRQYLLARSREIAKASPAQGR